MLFLFEEFKQDSVSTPGTMVLPGFFDAPPTCPQPAWPFSLWKRSAARPCERILRRVIRARRDLGEGFLGGATGCGGGAVGSCWVLV